MSMHKSLRLKNALQRRRNVLTRAERIEHLKEDERWREESDSVFGLPKTKSRVVAPTARRRKEEAEEAEETETEEENEG